MQRRAHAATKAIVAAETQDSVAGAGAVLPEIPAALFEIGDPQDGVRRLVDKEDPGMQPSPDATRDIRALLDRAEIEALMATNAAGLDEYDPEKASSIYADDAVLHFESGRGGAVVGRKEIAKAIGRDQAEFDFTHHQLGQTILQIDDDQASAITYCTAWHERHDGTRGTVWIRYLDELVRIDGSWRVRRRSLNLAGADGFDSAGWERVPRRGPSGLAERRAADG